MIIAAQKKKENIVEYIIYMMQIQDIIRALEFDINKIEDNLIIQYKVPEKEKQKIKEWYSNLIISMKEEKIAKAGNLNFINQLMDDLNKLHLKKVSENDDMQYIDAYNWAKNNILEYKEKAKLSSNNEIEICIHALYSLILLRLKKAKINTETSSAMQTFSNFMALLAAHYKKNMQ